MAEPASAPAATSGPSSPGTARLVRAIAAEDDALLLHPVDLFTRLSRTGLLLDALQRACLDPHGITFVEYSVLRLLQAAPKRRLAPSRLAERTVRTTGAITKLVDRLEHAGLLERRRDESDGRAIQVQLTPAGSRLATAASRSYGAARDRVLAKLSEREIQATNDSLDRLIELLEHDVAGVERRSR